MSQSLKDQLGAAVGYARAVNRQEAQDRLDARRYIVRVIDARDDWTKSVGPSLLTLTASKGKAIRFETMKLAVTSRNSLNKQDHVKSAWIVFD